jgi:hypothetical protein
MLLERPSCRWEDITEMDLIEIMWKGECVNWIHLAQDKGPVAASGSIKNGKFLQYLNNK